MIHAMVGLFGSGAFSDHLFEKTPERDLGRGVRNTSAFGIRKGNTFVARCFG